MILTIKRGGLVGTYNFLSSLEDYKGKKFHHFRSKNIRKLTPLLKEMEKKRNSREQAAGINVNFRKNRFQIGVSGLYYSYDRMYYPALREYNLGLAMLIGMATAVVLA